MPDVLIALGSNVGDRLLYLRESVVELRAKIEVLATSGVYETAPMYVTDQPSFLNAALLASSDLSPLNLLRLLKRIETKIGRETAARYGPREIDLDLVGYGSLKYRFTSLHEVRLQVPHPRTPERRFVLQPLADIAPDFNLPGIGKVRDMLSQTEVQAGNVRRVQDAILPI